MTSIAQTSLLTFQEALNHHLLEVIVQIEKLAPSTVAVVSSSLPVGRFTDELVTAPIETEGLGGTCVRMNSIE